MKTLLTLALLASLPSLADGGLDPKFFASAEFERRFPSAFALQAESRSFLEWSAKLTFADGDRLIGAILADEKLHGAILSFPSLSTQERIAVMRAVFALEVAQSGAEAPELVLDDSAKRETFFEFDPAHPSPGRVILNPSKLFADPNPYAALLFLVHETRHSQQFQLSAMAGAHPLGHGFAAGFGAQRAIFDQGIRPSFCDFLMLNQEYEAFLFGNYVLEVVTQGAVDTSDMGTLASQYVPGQGLRLDLLALARQVGAAGLLDAFNELEKAQYKP